MQSTMIPVQRFTLIKRKAGTTHEEFAEYWRTVHGPLARSLPAFWKFNNKYIQNHPIAVSDSSGQTPSYDGIAQTVQKPRENMQIGFANDPSYLEFIRPDELKFLTVRDLTSVFCHMHVIKDGPIGGVKHLVFISKPRGMSSQEFSHHWRNRHAQLMKEAAPFWTRLRRYVQNDVISEWPGNLPENSNRVPFAGVAELWFDSIEAAEEAFACSEYVAKVRPDEPRFAVQPPLAFMVTEHIFSESENCLSTP